MHAQGCPWLPEKIGGAAHAQGATIQSMGVDPGCLHVAMAQQFLDGADVITVL